MGRVSLQIKTGTTAHALHNLQMSSFMAQVQAGLWPYLVRGAEMKCGTAVVAVWFAALGAMHGAVLAQERIYRCGNEYTNDAVKGRQQGCQLLEGKHVTVVHTSPKPATAKASTVPGSSAAQVRPEQQKARDDSARAILEAELAKAQARLQALRAEFNEGNPGKTALELRNPQVFQERVEALKAQIARQEADVAGIQRELARRTGG